MIFKHFVLTRFNLYLENSHDKNHKLVRTNMWLNSRFTLFEKYCLPSLMNQSCKDFTWLVLFSLDTPQAYLEKIRGYEESFPSLKPLFLDDGKASTIEQAVNEALQHYIDKGHKYIITSRIDNDDAIHRDYISEVHNSFRRKENLFISFVYGLQYDIKSGVFARMKYSNNHFISRIEKLEDRIQTVITHEHTLINEIGEVLYINNKKNPMWLETIHEDNIINDLLYSSVPIFSNRVSSRFSINERCSKFNTILALLRFIRHKILILRSNILKRLGIYDRMRLVLKGRY